MAEKVKFVADADLAPELAPGRTKRGLNHVAGYTTQQIMKLAAADLVPTQWYLTLDADVICIRNTSFLSLLPSGRATVNRTPLSRHRDWCK